MLKFIVAVFFILHGLVHLLYCGQSQRAFALQPGMVWSDGAWAFARVLGEASTRLLATVLLALAAMGFVAAGIGLLAGWAWWRPVWPWVFGLAVLNGLFLVIGSVILVYFFDLNNPDLFVNSFFFSVLSLLLAVPLGRVYDGREGGVGVVVRPAGRSTLP